MSVKAFFKPTKQKLIIDITISLASLIAFFTLTPNAAESLKEPAQMLLIIALNLIILPIIFYPLACSLIFLYNREWRKTNKTETIIALFSLLVLNPISLNLINTSLTHYNNNIINQPCGIMVAAVTPNYPAEKAGIKKGETITDVDGIRTDTPDMFKNAIKYKHPGDQTTIETDRGTITLQPIEDPQTHNPTYGLIINTKYCKRSN